MSRPDWLQPLVRLQEQMRPEDLALVPPLERTQGRASAVLLLFWHDDERGVQILLIERAAELRRHAGQPGFPGGVVEPDDASVVAAALRESVEETGLDPAGIDVLGVLPELFIPVTEYLVTPVLAWWHTPSPVAAVDSREVAAVHAVAVADLVSSANRLLVRHRPSGRVMPGFRVNGMLVWGFTAVVLDHLVRLCGWERPWSRELVVDLPDTAALDSAVL